MSVAYGEQQRQGSAFGARASGVGSQRDLEQQYHVVLQDSLGHPALGFRDGAWFRLSVQGPQALQLRGAIRTCPHAAGSIVQIACWWMRENPLQPRSLDLATELALTVGELVRVCPADGLGNSSMDLLPMAMAAVAPSTPAVPAQPALPAGSGSGDSFGAGAPFGSQGSTFANGSQTYAANGTTYANGSSYGTSAANGTSYGTSPANGSSYGTSTANGSSYGTTANGSSYGSTSTSPSYSTANTTAASSHAPAASGSWFDSSDTTGTGGFPAVPPAPVVGRNAAPSQQSAPPRPAAYPPAPRGYGGNAAPQAALPPSRGYSDPGASADDWDRPAPAPAAPRRPPSHQPRPQQAAAPRPAPGAGANGQVPRPRPVPPRDDRRDTFERRLGLEEQESLGRSSDRNNGVPPRRPAPAQAQRPQRGTMGQRPASRPGRPSDW